MQVAACPDVTVVSKEDVPEEAIKKEREIEMAKEDLLEKPEQVRRPSMLSIRACYCSVF